MALCYSHTGRLIIHRQQDHATGGEDMEGVRMEGIKAQNPKSSTLSLGIQVKLLVVNKKWQREAK